MKKPRFSLKTLVWVLTLCAVLLGWWADHKRLSDRIEDLQGSEEQSISWDDIEWGPIPASQY